MKKNLKTILLIMLVALSLIFIYYMIFKEVEIGFVKVDGVKKVKAESMKLDKSIAETNKLIDEEHKNATETLETEAKLLTEAKEAYLNYVNQTDNAQILSANSEEKFQTEFLWTRIGNYATKEGVTIKFEIVEQSKHEEKKSTSCNLNFTVGGNYISIVDFLYSIEEDMDLNFAIDNFKFIKDVDGRLKATFTVSNVEIDNESLKSSSTTVNIENATNEANTSDSKAENSASGDSKENTSESTTAANNS